MQRVCSQDICNDKLFFVTVSIGTAYGIGFSGLLTYYAITGGGSCRGGAPCKQNSAVFIQLSVRVDTKGVGVKTCSQLVAQ